jgi:hypothetical protein
VKKLVAIFVVGVALLIDGLPLRGQTGRTYTTNFDATENPISEGGNWINGAAQGLDWKDMRSANGYAYGTQDGSGGPPYNDSTAVLTGTWGPDQTVQAVVRSVNQQTGTVYEEVEIRLRTTIAAHSIKGYEVLWRANHDGTQYHQIGHWYGPIGTGGCTLGCAFAAVPGSIDMRAANGNPGIYDGDTVGASIIGNRITTWVIHNGVKQVLQDFNDTSGAGGNAYFTTGSPGMGHWLRGPGSLISDYGFTSYTASDAGLPPAPRAPTNVRIITALRLLSNPFALLLPPGLLDTPRETAPTH